LKVTVIGGSGFLGNSLCHELLKSHIEFEILDLVHPDKKFIDHYKFFDVTSSFDESIIDGDIIINLAAQHRDNVHPVSLYDEVNVGGAKNICKIACKKEIDKIIFISSVAVFGNSKNEINEDSEFNFFNDYGRTKLLAEKVFIEWYEADEENRNLTIIRPTVIFGEKNRGNVFNLIKQIKENKFIMIGNGKNKKSMCYVKNVAAFINFSLNHIDGKKLVNYSDKPDLEMNELVDFINLKFNKKRWLNFYIPNSLGLSAGLFFDFLSKFFNLKLSISYIRIKKFISSSEISNELVRKLGFKAPFSISDSLSSTIDYELKEGRFKDVS
tara:strand:- start:507 stop:1484 length:978 start_codon:yes stop_codon:yes gene_type:complete